jgi:hypothetical protein
VKKSGLAGTLVAVTLAASPGNASAGALEYCVDSADVKTWYPLLGAYDDASRECELADRVGYSSTIGNYKGDYEIATFTSPSSRMLFVSNVGDNAAGYASGAHDVRLWELDPATGLQTATSSILLGTNFTGIATMNGPEFVGTSGGTWDLGVAYPGPTGVKLVRHTAGQPVFDVTKWATTSIGPTYTVVYPGATFNEGTDEIWLFCPADPALTALPGKCPAGNNLWFVSDVDQATPTTSAAFAVPSAARAGEIHPAFDQTFAVTWYDGVADEGWLSYDPPASAQVDLPLGTFLGSAFEPIDEIESVASTPVVIWNGIEGSLWAIVHRDGHIRYYAEFGSTWLPVGATLTHHVDWGYVNEPGTPPFEDPCTEEEVPRPGGGQFTIVDCDPVGMPDLDGPEWVQDYADASHLRFETHPVNGDLLLVFQDRTRDGYGDLTATTGTWAVRVSIVVDDVADEATITIDLPNHVSACDHGAEMLPISSGDWRVMVPSEDSVGDDKVYVCATDL